MKTIYAIVGDHYHAEDHIRQSLSLALKPWAEAESVQLEYITTEELAERLQRKPSALVLFKEDRVNPRDEQVVHWLTEEISAAMVRYVEEGGGLLVWHSGLASYPQESAFIQMLRGFFEYHPPKHQTVTYSGSLPADPSAAVSFDILDEHYFVTCDEAHTNVFLKSKSVDGESIAGWTHQVGKGRVVCLTPAHNVEGLLHKDMLELLLSSLRLSSEE
jgi:type 1 glutamine amidotransferase